MRFMRIMVGLDSEEPWTREQREQVHAAIGNIFFDAHRRGELTPSEWLETEQRIRTVHVNLSRFPPPKAGEDACRQGFWRRENPYKKGSKAHKRWNAAYDREPRMLDYERSLQFGHDDTGDDDGGDDE